MSLKQTLVAMLMSVFVFPGSGHFLLKQRRRGMLFVAATIALFGGFLFQLYTITQSEAKALAENATTTDVVVLTKQLTEQILTHHAAFLSQFVYAIGFLMLLCIADLFFIFWQRSRHEHVG